MQKRFLPRTSLVLLSAILFASFIGFGVPSVHADVRLPGFFTDHMVLQQQMPIRIWGWADPGEKVVVSLGDQMAMVVTGDEGRWEIQLEAMKASRQPHTIEIKGNNTLQLSDVLIGEVWLCSGQSNMEWTVQQCGNAAEEIANGNWPLIRHAKVPTRPSPIPLDDISAPWQVCSPETVANFSATAYYTAVNLHKDLDVPIGLINSCWGGTRIEPWTTPNGFSQVPALQELNRKVAKRTPGTESHRQAIEQHMAETQAWLTAARFQLDAKLPIAASPAFPPELQLLTNRQDPTALYNGMIHAMVGIPVRGVLWYQGESNRADGMMYFEKKKALINGWRALWRQESLPFYFVQVAPFNYGQDDPEQLAELWEAQAATLEIPDTAMVITNDIATLGNIHPPNKQDVGKRLAAIALKKLYGKESLVAESPIMESMKIAGNKIELTFANTGGGLKTRDGNSASHFELVGNGSEGFQPANVTISKDRIILHSDAVANPTAFRFAWHKTAQPNLIGGTGLPVGAVRGGKVPDFLSEIGGFDDFELAYDLDLAKLGKEIEYSVDRHGSISGFDKIGYLLELESDKHGKQKLFVAMKAFTDDIRKIAVPTLQSNAFFQQSLENMSVFTNVDGVTTGRDLESGNIEFWPNNYRQNNSAGVANASETMFDFGDERYGPEAGGYGSMQIHNYATKETIFAINHWSEGPKADIGIGSNKEGFSDWTFKENAKVYSKKRLRVYVRPSR